MISKFYSTKVVIDSETLELIERDVIPYDGPWELAEGEPGPVGDGGAAAPSDAPPQDTPTPDQVMDDYVDGADQPPADEPPQDQPPQDTPPDQPKPGDGQPAKQPTPQELAADATLKKAYRENFGSVREVIKQHPELRPAFFKAAELNELFTTIEDGKQAKEWANQLYQFDNLYYSRNPEDKRAFLQSLYENSLDEAGNSPHYDQVASIIVGDGLSNLATRIQQGDQRISRAFADLGLNGKQATVAVQAVAAMLGIPLSGVKFSTGGGGTPQGTPGQLSEREQYLTNEVSRLNSELEAGRNSSLVQSERLFYDNIRSTANGNINSAIDKFLEPATGLKSQKPGFQSWVKSEIFNRITAAVKSDQFFANQMESMSRSGNRGQEHQQQMIAALEQRARQYLTDVAREVLQEAGIQIQQRANGKGNQAGAPHREPATSGTPGRLTKPGQSNPKKPQAGESYNEYAKRLMEIE